MEWILVTMLIITSYFTVLFFVQKYNIMSAKRQLKDICNHPELNLRIMLSAPNKDMEELLAAINNYIDVYQKQQITHLREEKKIKQEIANISHDLRTPLTSILGFLSIIKDESIDDTERNEYLSIIRKKGEVMKTLVESFYELSNVEANDYVIRKENVYLYNTICEILLAFYQDFENKKIEVILELEEDTPALSLDQNGVIRIITNLIQNALRYATSFLKIELKKSGDQVLLRFTNDTLLMNETDINRIFDRTYTADYSRNLGGTGLGLSIAKKLVDLQDGHIQAGLQDNIFEINIIWNLTM